MKKIITLLALMIVLAGAAFAANNDTLYVTASVASKAPTYVIYGGTTADVGTGIVGSTGGLKTSNTIALDFDPSDTTDEGKVFVRLDQKTLSKTTSKVDLTITASALANVQESGTNLADLTGYATDIPYAHVESTKTVTGIKQIGRSPISAQNVVTYEMKYDGRNVAADSTIGVVSFTWAPKASLPVGNYQATIELAYTVN